MKKAILIILGILTLGLVTFLVYLQRKQSAAAAAGDGAAPAPSNDKKGNTSLPPATPPPTPAPGLTPPSQAAVDQAATGAVPNVPSRYVLPIFAGSMDWRAYAPIKALWAQRVAALKSQYITAISADQDAPFLMQAAGILADQVKAGSLSFQPGIGGNTMTPNWQAVLIWSRIYSEAKKAGIILPPSYTA
jgi:hypothetical protein